MLEQEIKKVSVIENIKRKFLAKILYGDSSQNGTKKLQRDTRRNGNEQGEFLYNDCKLNDEQIQKLIDLIEPDYFKLKNIKHYRACNK